MTPQAFIEKWRDIELKERSASQSHFNDLCRLLDVLDPTTADPKGTWFTFEKGASKTSGGEGWADVWRENCFGWEYKGKRKDLNAALAQLRQYALALDNPPLLIVSDMDQIHIHTNWTNTVHKTYQLTLEDLRDAGKRDLLRHAFTDPERLKPEKTRQLLTEEAAQKFAAIAQRLRERDHNAEDVAHFVNRLVFCMFAEDVNLLPNKMFERMLKLCLNKASDFEGHAKDLFSAMKSGGKVGFEFVEWFNGGLFDSDLAFPLTKPDIEDLIEAAKLDWSDVDPSIMGTLFERGLDPDKRSQLGAHYTDRDKIMMIVNPVIVEPLLAEWVEVKTKITALLDNAPKATKTKLLKGAELTASTKAKAAAEKLHQTFLEKLKAFRVLDPACGSGNFLYLSLLELKNIEHKVNLEAEALGLPRGFPSIGPEAVLGIELNAYAAELARVSVWIGEIQWMRRNGFEVARNPILRTLETIQNRDAILNQDGSETEWPDSDVIVGNPPFLGAKLMKRKLGIKETDILRFAFADRLPGFTDLVCYWFEKARNCLVTRNTQRVGFVATSKIAKNTNLPVLNRIVADCEIYNAFSDQPWVVDGAAVRVALISFARKNSTYLIRALEGSTVEFINPDLTAGLNVSSAKNLTENKNTSFIGVQKSGPFDIPGELARKWLNAPLNPNGRPNSDILRPTWNGSDLTTTRTDTWFIDFARGLKIQDAALWEPPFEYLQTTLYDTDNPEAGYLADVRAGARDLHPRNEWWTPYWPRPEVRSKISTLNRYIVTPMTSEHRVFVWLHYPTLPDNNLVIFAIEDATIFGVLHSVFHECWSTRIGNKIGVGNQRRYNPASIFETFPFPEDLTPNIAAASYAADRRAIKIAAAAERLNTLRENWLNPADLVKRVPEVVAGYPDRILPVSEAAAMELKNRTLTKLYNARPAWLDNAHKALDEAVAEAYGWGDDWRAGKLTEDEILARLFKLNQERGSNE
jgi:type II restriction/modification system DNA methylase subunit YeeA